MAKMYQLFREVDRSLGSGAVFTEDEKSQARAEWIDWCNNKEPSRRPQVNDIQPGNKEKPKFWAQVVCHWQLADATPDEVRRYEAYQNKFENLCTVMGNILNKEVEAVVISNQLGEAPCSMVTFQHGRITDMEIRDGEAGGILRGQALKDYMTSKKLLEINPNHNIVRFLRRAVTEVFASEDTSTVPSEDGHCRVLVQLLHELALLTPTALRQHADGLQMMLETMSGSHSGMDREGVSVMDEDNKRESGTGADNDEEMTEGSADEEAGEPRSEITNDWTNNLANWAQITADLTVLICPAECRAKIRGRAALKKHLVKRQQSGICDV